MRSSFFLAALASSAAAFPSMKDLTKAVAKRQFASSTELLGDLVELEDDELTKVGKDVKAILLGEGPGQSTKGYKAPPMNSYQCKEDECCVWKYIAEEMYDMMYDAEADKCNDFARGAIRMGFHDAAAWNKFLPSGGADGSILLSDDEMDRFENVAMVGTAEKIRGLMTKYEDFGIGMADLIQCAAKVGALACPGGPRIRMFIGREDSSDSAPTGLLPPPFLGAEAIIDLFADKTVGPGGIVALVGAHTASHNHGQNGAVPQDKTPGKWDTEYFDEHLRPNASEGVLRFPSDVNLANSNVTGPVFQQFASQKSSWDEAYAKEYIRMSLMGVKKINKMKECSKAMPKGDDSSEPEPSYSMSESAEPTYEPTYSTEASTSTIYTSEVVTVTSCPPEKTDCPYGPKNPLTTYSVYPVGTTVYDVTHTSYPTGKPDYPKDDKYPADKPSYPVEKPDYPGTTYAPKPTAGADDTPVTAGAGRAAAGLVAVAAGLVAAFF